jgi:hypothetical protein
MRPQCNLFYRVLKLLVVQDCGAVQYIQLSLVPESYCGFTRHIRHGSLKFWTRLHSGAHCVCAFPQLIAPQVGEGGTYDGYRL